MSPEEVIEKVSHIPSNVHNPEITMWVEEVSKLKGNPVIVDFGTGHGKSAAAFALSNPNATIYTFDPGEPYTGASPTDEEKQSYIDETEKFMADSGANNIEFRRESSLETEWDQPVDVLNIDSDHTYKTTYDEIDRWLPFVKSGGLIFFHDYEHPRCPGIKQAIDELVPSKYQMELQKITKAGDVWCAFYIKD